MPIHTGARSIANASGISRRDFLQPGALGVFGLTMPNRLSVPAESGKSCIPVFYGGGIKFGRAIGSSDEIGAIPADRPVQLQNLIAAIYKELGVDACTMLPGRDGAAVPVSKHGTQAIEELF